MDFSFSIPNLAKQRRTTSTNDVAPFPPPGLTHWYSALAPSSISLDGTEIREVANLVTGGIPLRAVEGSAGSGGPNFASPSGVPAFTWPNVANQIGLALSNAPGSFIDTAVAEMFIVAQYQDGLTGLFSGFSTIATPIAGLTGLGGDRIFGGDRNSVLWSSGIDQVSINGAAFSNQFLPCLRSVLRFSAARTAWPSGFLTGAFGSKNGNRSRGWRGEMHEIMLFDRALTPDEVSDVESHLMQKWDIAV